MAAISSNESKHADFSPSKASRLVRCPGSLAFCEDIPDVESADAKLGTRAHKAAEELLKGRPYDKDFVLEYGVSIAVPVLTYYEAVMSRVGSLLVESKLPLTGITGEGGAEGTSDAVIIGDSYIEVHDYKNGRGVQVFAADNEQCEMYALGALDKYGRVFGPFDEVRMFIHQPNLDHLDYAVMTVEALEAKREEFFAKARIAFALRDLPPGDRRDAEIRQRLNPGEKQCKFCPGKATCPAFEKYVREAIGLKFDEMNKDSIRLVLANIDEQHSARIADLYKHLNMVAMWVKAVDQEARTLAEVGSLPGYKIVQTRAGIRAWENEELVVEFLKNTVRLRDDDIYTQKLLSPTQLEKMMKDNPIQWRRVSAMVKRGEPSKAIVPASDPRPIVESVADKFDAEED